MKYTLIIILMVIVNYVFNYAIADNLFTTSSNKQGDYLMNSLLVKEKKKEIIINLKKKYRPLKFKISGKKIDLRNFTLIVDAQDIKKQKKYIVWQRNIKCITPQEIPKSFTFSEITSNNTIALAYVEGFSVRFFEIDLTIPFDELKDLNKKGETKIIATDPSVIPVPKILGKKYLVQLAESSLIIEKVSKTDDGWKVIVKIANEKFSFYQEKRRSGIGWVE